MHLCISTVANYIEQPLRGRWTSSACLVSGQVSPALWRVRNSSWCRCVPG